MVDPRVDNNVARLVSGLDVRAKSGSERLLDGARARPKEEALRYICETYGGSRGSEADDQNYLNIDGRLDF